jgi:hypothetical protein
MVDTLVEKIAPLLTPFLRDGRLRVTLEKREESFGDAVVELESSDFDMRVVRDRGLVTFDVSPHAKGDWHPLEMVLDFIGKGALSLGPQTLDKNFEKISLLMTSNLSKVGFLQFKKQQSEAYLKKTFPTS